MTSETIVLGHEADEVPLRIVGSVLRERGAELDDSWNGVSGSQDVHHWEFVIDGEPVIVETETYEGITVSGESSIVRAIALDVQTRLSE